jgi:DNA-binding LacI/PurR family transcriptional regulator
MSTARARRSSRPRAVAPRAMAKRAQSRRTAPTDAVPSRAVTSREVAQLAGVSRSAVSRTFTPEASVSPETRRRVLDAATRLGYQPDVIARSLITRRSRLIGLVMGEWENPFYTTMLRSFSEKLQMRDYQLMLLARGPDGSVDGAVRLLMQYRVDGIVLTSCEPSAPVARACAAAGVRLVFINREPGDLPATGVFSDNARIGRDVAEMLIRAGYERLAIVCGDATLATAVVRHRAFRAAVAATRRARLVIDQSGVMGYAAGRRFIGEALRGPQRPDAVFCSSDLTAIGVLDGARLDAKVRVPDDLAIVGFGDVPAAAWGCNDLTTVRLPVERMIDASIEALLAPQPPEPRPLVLLEAGIVQRATVRLVNGSDAR